MKKTYKVRVIQEVELEIDSKIIKAVDENWRKTFYKHVKTPQDIANHIGYNVLVNDAQLSNLDGFANLSNNLVKVLRRSSEIEE